jgi:hypothetical protein
MTYDYREVFGGRALPASNSSIYNRFQVGQTPGFCKLSETSTD